MYCSYCGVEENEKHGLSCPADPETNKHLVEKFGPMAAISNPWVKRENGWMQPLKKIPFNDEGSVFNHLPNVLAPPLGYREYEERPWGSFEVIDENKDTAPFWKVKKLKIKPGQAISLQTHKEREETWKVVAGSGKVQLGDGFFNLDANDFSKSVFIPVLEKHKLSAGPNGITVIEIAMSHTGPVQESDIVRYQDDYGRV